jgi:hypothetical protein
LGAPNQLALSKIQLYNCQGQSLSCFKNRWTGIVWVFDSFFLQFFAFVKMVKQKKFPSFTDFIGAGACVASFLGSFSQRSWLILHVFCAERIKQDKQIKGGR